MKKCPIGNSSKYKENHLGKRCEKCGYENKSEISMGNEGVNKLN